MIPGKVFSPKGVARNSTYTFLPMIDNQISGHSFGDNNKVDYNMAVDISVIKNSNYDDRLKNTQFNSNGNIVIPVDSDSDIVKSTRVPLPFRMPILIEEPNLGFNSLSNNDFNKINEDYDKSKLRWDNDDRRGSMIELNILEGWLENTVNRESKYFWEKRFNYNKSFGGALSSAYSSSKDKYYYCLFGSHDKIIAYPSNIELTADGEEIYISYIANVMLKYGVSFYKGTDIPKPNGYGKPTTGEPYTDVNKTRATYSYSVPMIYRIYYDNESKLHTRTTFDHVSSPLSIKGTNKLAPTISSDYSWNNRIIPYFRTRPFDDHNTRLKLPSNNQCIQTTYFDKGRNRLVVAVTYESPESNDWPNSYRLYLRYYDVATAISWFPDSTNDGPVYTHIQDQLDKKNKVTFGNKMNISSLDITKWDDNYIICVGYNKGTTKSLNTVMFKVDATENLDSGSRIQYMTHFSNIGYGSILGLSSGRPE